MRIGELSERTGVSCDALRMYEKRGLITALRRGNGYRDFDSAMVQIVGMIRLAQRLGFSLTEISALLAQMNRGLSEVDVAEVLGEKLNEIDAKIAGLQELRQILQARIAAACPLGLT
ncbi:MerR family transcriptional regulator [Cognatishimia sp. SS12]|uniref:MerR family transcriptional regulator n=1 Tax=Cognatishimia sp. SS12 TaxID=2979465 RepID=UPI00232EE28E|nr:MerR family transcriptional regulator [Cognatishimia sp. SS12]MDC0738575.1 MerR family transcriptional regulator [Cognatishimia sp. SS12]